MDDVAYGANFWNAVDDAMPAINPVKPESNSDNSTPMTFIVLEILKPLWKICKEIDSNLKNVTR